MALYELVQLRSGLDRCLEHFSLERFRDLLGVPPGKLTRGPDFNVGSSSPHFWRSMVSRT